MDKDTFTTMPATAMSTGESFTRYLCIIVLLWSMPVALTILSAPQRLIAGDTIMAGIVSGGLIVFKPKVAVVALPFFTLLSPVAGFFGAFGARLLLSDLLFVLLAVQTIVLFFEGKFKIFLSSLYSLECLLLILFLFSVMLGIITSTLISFKPVLYLAELIIVYFYTKVFCRDEKSWSLMINSWIAAVFLGALLLIHAFVTGRSLVNFKLLSNAKLAVQQNVDYLVQATYYYPTFHFALGLSIIFLIIKLFNFKYSQKFLTLPLLIIDCLALFLMDKKTTIFSLPIAFLILILLFSRKWSRKNLFAFFSAVTVFFIIGVSFLKFINRVEAYLWVARLTGSGSLHVRLRNYSMVLATCLSFPLHLLTGMGPDFLVDSGAPRVVSLFKMPGEGTVDSGWISFLIEMGFVGFVAFVLLFARSIRRTLKYTKRINSGSLWSSPSLCVLTGLIYLAIALSTQMIGYTKVAWFPYQIMIVGLMHKKLLLKENLK